MQTIMQLTHNQYIIPDVKKIAVVRANSLGDFIFALPALEMLRGTYKDAEIVLLGKEWHREFLKERPGPVDRVEVIPKCHGMPHESDRVVDPEEVEAFFSRMRDEKFDIALQMHGGGKNSNPFTKKLGARVSAGYQAPGAMALDINVPYFLHQHEVLRYLELVSYVGAHKLPIEPHLTVTASDRAEVQEKIGDLRKPFVVLHPGASDVQRRWSPVNFVSVGKMIMNKGFHVYITATGDEMVAAQRVHEGLGERSHLLYNRLSINGLTALLAEANLLISNDTGPLHVARAVGTPTVGIYWCGNVVTAGVVTAKKNRIAIAWRYHCPLCSIDCMVENVHHPSGNCKHDASFVDDITVEEVAGYAADLLKYSEKEVVG